MRAFSRDQITVRAIGVEDWPLWRRLRLQALEDAPYAFSARLADWQGQGDTEIRWRARLSAVAFNAIATWQETAAGMVSGTALTPDGAIELISMWVAPFARGRGISNALADAVLAWAEKQQASKVVLGVAAGNDRAAAFYRREGFIESDPAGETGAERRMARSLR